MLQHGRASKGKHSLFNFVVDVGKLGCHVRLGESCEVLIGLVSATSYGSRAVPGDTYGLAQLVDAPLPTAEDGVHIEMLPFSGKDAFQTACELVQVIQRLLTNRPGGEDRYREAAGLGGPRQSKPVPLELMDVPCVPAARKRPREESR